MTTIYAINVLSILSFLLLWFFSPLKLTLGKLFFKKDFIIPDEFDDRVFMFNSFLGKLQSCYICTSFWISLITGVIFLVLFSMPMYWPFLMFFTTPPIAYIFKKLVS